MVSELLRHFIFHSWQRAPNTCFMKTLLYIAYYQSHLFQILSTSPPPTQPSPALLFLLMDLHMSSLCIIVSEGPCCVFYATRSLLRSDTKYDSLLVLWFDITLTNTHSTHRGQTHTYKYILTPPVMCSQQLSILKWMNNLLISKICFPKFSNLFAFQKLLTCSHISAD